ncbi:MAG: hypothetical protein ABIT37_08585 [Luteolibacter sp.]
MKSALFTPAPPLFHAITGIVVLFAAPHASAAPGQMRDVPTHEQLSLKRGQMEQVDPMKNMAVSKTEDPAKNLPTDLISQSDVISFAGVATLVPKHAIILIPKNYQDRVAFAPGSTIKSWTEFYTANRGWITTVEVSFAQAQGKDPIPEATTKQFTKSGNMVVAVYLGGPISMLPK